MDDDTGSVAGGYPTDLQQCTVVGGTDHHHKASVVGPVHTDRVAERVQDRAVRHTVAASGVDDDRGIHDGI